MIELKMNSRKNQAATAKTRQGHPGNLTLKLEGSPDGGPNWVLTQPVTTLNIT
jgi:hypothetical protein